MISQTEFGQNSMTVTKQAMPESDKFDGPSGINTSGEQNKFAANSNSSLAKPGSSN
jgi:hypothetical protein